MRSKSLRPIAAAIASMVARSTSARGPEAVVRRDRVGDGLGQRHAEAVGRAGEGPEVVRVRHVWGSFRGVAGVGLSAAEQGRERVVVGQVVGVVLALGERRQGVG